MLNRTALLLRYKEPAIHWINKTDPLEEAPVLTKDLINNERTVYLISEEDGENEASQKVWIRRNYKQLFEAELEGWYTDPDLWPRPLTLELFYKWFHPEFNSVIIDTVDRSLLDDGY